jgi:hypothetical protein
VRDEHVPVGESIRYEAGDDELSVLASDGRVFGFSLMPGAVSSSGVWTSTMTGRFAKLL